MDPIANENLRSPGQIRHQLKQVMFRHLQKELRDNFKDTPEACVYNHLTTIGSERVGICRCDAVPVEGLPSPRGKVCDARVAGCIMQARGCKHRRPYRTKEEVKSDFRALMASDRGAIAARYPDVAALMWVLDGVDFMEVLRQAEDEADPPPPPEPSPEQAL